MTCHRRYSFAFQDQNVEHDNVRSLLEQACETHWWFSEPSVTETEQTPMLVEFQVAGRDQWWCHRRAMDLVANVVWEYGYDVPIPTWVALPPHENRGYSRFRK